MLSNDVYKKLANCIARGFGHGKATSYVFEDVKSPYVKEHIPYGYRKKTTGEYVPNAYRMKFGWKNTYYQHAVTVIAMPKKWID